MSYLFSAGRTNFGRVVASVLFVIVVASRSLAQPHDSRNHAQANSVSSSEDSSLVNKSIKKVYGRKQLQHERRQERVLLSALPRLEIISSYNMDNAELNTESLPKDFIYVYNLGQEDNYKLFDSETTYWSSQYEGELEIFKMLAEKNISRTTDPEKATLFYIPFFACRYLHVKFSKHTKAGDNRMWSQLHLGVKETSERFQEIVETISRDFPYFNRSNGRDHFSVLTQDHGRCGALPFIDPVVYGEMFFLQLNGDKMVQSNFAATERGMQVLNFNWGKQFFSNQFPAIPCYMADRDIVIPAVVRGTEIVPPTKNWEERSTLALFRFSPIMDHSVKIPFWRHYVRTELYELWHDKESPEGFEFGVKTEAESQKDWEKAKFCACPPGHSQWTSRIVKAILSGCIPITFFKEHDNPWQDEIAYELFTVNIDIDKLHTLKSRLDAIVNSPDLLQYMQQQLEKVQDMFLWGEHGGVWKQIEKSLQQRGTQLFHKKQALAKYEAMLMKS